MVVLYTPQLITSNPESYDCRESLMLSKLFMFLFMLGVVVQHGTLEILRFMMTESRTEIKLHRIPRSEEKPGHIYMIRQISRFFDQSSRTADETDQQNVTKNGSVSKSV